MKRSAQVPASLIATLAAGLSVTGCGGRRAIRECQDAMGRVLPDTSCTSGVPGAHWVTRTIRTGGFGSSGTYGGGFFGG